MERTSRSLGFIIGILLIINAGLVPAIAAPAASPPAAGEQAPLVTPREEFAADNHTNATGSMPDGPTEFLTAFRSFRNDSAIREYGAFEVVRTIAMSDIQTSDKFTGKDRQQMELLLRALQTFVHAYELAQNESLERSLSMANRTSELLVKLDAAGGSRYGTLAEIGLDRFYTDLGEQLVNRSRSGVSTPQRISLLRKAAIAHRTGGNSNRFAQLSAKAENLTVEYRRDREEINASFATVSSFFDKCQNRCETPIVTIRTNRFAVFDLYQQALEARAEVIQAESLAEEHRLDSEITRYRQARDQTVDYLITLIIASIILIGGYALALGIPAILVYLRLAAWSKDQDAANVGSILKSQPVTEVYDATE